MKNNFLIDLAGLYFASQITNVSPIEGLNLVLESEREIMAKEFILNVEEQFIQNEI
jgi:hypothetical protein